MQKIIQYADPSTLKLHKVHHGIPVNQDVVDQIADTLLNGGETIREPLKITPDLQVVDGRHRFLAAKKAQLTEVPCILVAADHAAEIALETLLARRHFTKGQRAYLAAPLLEATINEYGQRRLNNIKRGEATDLQFGRSAERLAEKLGIGGRLLEQSRTIHLAFDAHPEWRAQDEPKILDPEKPIGLGAIIAGFAGRTTTKGKPRQDTPQQELFADSWDVLGKRFKYWTDMDEAAKHEALTPIKETLAVMPDDLLAATLKAANAEQKRRDAEKAQNPVAADVRRL